MSEILNAKFKGTDDYRDKKGYYFEVDGIELFLNKHEVISTQRFPSVVKVEEFLLTQQGQNLLAYKLETMGETDG